MQPFALRGITLGPWRPWVDHPDRTKTDCANLLKAGILKDLLPQKNALSLFLVDQELTRFETIAAAMTAKKERLDRFDGILFSTELIAPLGIQVAETPGDTNHAIVDTWHIDLTDLTFGQLVNLVYELCRSPLTKHLSSTKVGLARKICDAVDAGHYPGEQPKESLMIAARKLLEP